MRAASSRVLAVDPDRVWEVLADYGEVARWGRGLSHSSLLSGQTDGVGAVRRVQVGREAVRETVLVWEPRQRLSYAIAGLPRVVRQASNTWTLAPDAEGTRVTLTSEVHTVPPPLARVVLRVMARTSKGLLDGLEAHLATTQESP